jgi:putative endonuclease
MKDERDQQSTSEKGRLGEEIALRHLAEMGYDILETRYKFLGAEIDVIAETKTHLVFVEVKLRFTDTYGDPWEAVNPKKRRRIVLAADGYIKSSPSEKEPRFDIISIVYLGGKPRITHIEDAFWPSA